MHYHYSFRLRGLRYRGALPEARTKAEAEQAVNKLRLDVFERKFGKVETGTMKLEDFIDQIYLPWAKTNKKSWLNDHYNSATLKKHFNGKSLRQIRPLDVERLKMKTTERYIRANRFSREVEVRANGHKLATNEIRPPVLAAVNG